MTALKLRLVRSRYLKHSLVVSSSFSSLRSWTGLCHVLLDHSQPSAPDAEPCRVPLYYRLQLLNMHEIVQDLTGFWHVDRAHLQELQNSLPQHIDGSKQKTAMNKREER